MQTTTARTASSDQSLGRQLWPELVLLVGAALVVAGVGLGRHVDGKNLSIGGVDAAAIVIAVAISAVLCFATAFTGRIAKMMRARRGEGLVVLVTATFAALASIPVSLITGWAIWYSVGPGVF